MSFKGMFGILLLLSIASASYNGNLTLNISHGTTLDTQVNGSVVNGSWFFLFNFTPAAGQDYNFSYAIDGVWRVFPDTHTLYHPFGAFSIAGNSTGGNGTGNITGSGVANSLCMFNDTGNIVNSSFIITGGSTVQWKQNSTTPTLMVYNAGGAGGAAFQFKDDFSTANWVFKATSFGGFKIRDAFALQDVMTLDQNASPNSIYIRGVLPYRGYIGLNTSAATYPLDMNFQLFAMRASDNPAQKMCISVTSLGIITAVAC